MTFALLTIKSSMKLEPACVILLGCNLTLTIESPYWRRPRRYPGFKSRKGLHMCDRKLIVVSVRKPRPNPAGFFFARIHDQCAIPYNVLKKAAPTAY